MGIDHRLHRMATPLPLKGQRRLATGCCLHHHDTSPNTTAPATELNQTMASNPVADDQPSAPTTPKPANIIAQVAG